MNLAIEKAYVAVTEGQLHLRCANSEAGGLPLILMHASPASSRALEPLMQALGDAAPLYAFDTPGNGQSCSPSQAQPEMADYSDILSRGTQALGLEQVVLYGTHTGAHIGIEWALAQPGKVAGLILDGVALFDEGTRKEYLEVYAPPQQPDETGTQYHWAWHYMRDQMIFFPHFKKDEAHRRVGGTFDADTLHNLTLDILNNLSTYHQPYEAVFRHEVRDALKRLAVPVLILAEGEGPLQEATDELCRLVPHASLANDCHGPTERASAIKAFLRGISGG